MCKSKLSRRALDLLGKTFKQTINGNYKGKMLITHHTLMISNTLQISNPTTSSPNPIFKRIISRFQQQVRVKLFHQVQSSTNRNSLHSLSPLLQILSLLLKNYSNLNSIIKNLKVTRRNKESRWMILWTLSMAIRTSGKEKRKRKTH